MRVRALDQYGDWTFGAGLNNYLTGTAAVAQTIRSRLLMFLGDCFFATNEGIDWFTFLGTPGPQNQLGLQLAINAIILNTDNVTGVVQLSLSFNRQTRAFSITYEVTTSFGNTGGTVVQTAGGSPPVPNNLLPQFNQTLLNNVSATPINGAAFSSVAFWGVDLQYYIERRTATQNFIQRGVVLCEFNPATSQWSLTDNVLSGSSGPTSGVTFTINPTTGQVSYASDNVTGSSYVGNLIIGATNSFVAGV